MRGPCLIAYADRFGGDLPSLSRVLRGPLGRAFGSLHLLPFYDPIDGHDAGFDPIDHLAVDARVGTWADLAVLGGEVDVLADVIVNHVSQESREFQKAVAGDVDALSMFLTRDRVFGSEPQPTLEARIYRPRPTAPFSRLTLADGSSRDFWTTFSAQQMDIDVESKQGRSYLSSILERLAKAEVRCLRLDAAGYAIKRAGTNCFMLPETYAFLAALQEQAHSLGMKVLLEAHAHHSLQLEAAKVVDFVYDFALPPLMLHALFSSDAQPLKDWLAIAPRNCMTVLDTHDGIGIRDVASSEGESGLLPDAAVDALVEGVHQRSQGGSREATGIAASNLDIYQVNCTFFDALGRSEQDYLLARATQLFLPGIPQIYYVGLLAGTNDLERLRRTGVGRDINRRAYTEVEISEAVARPLVRSILDLVALRREHPAFSGRFELLPSPPSTLAVEWHHAADSLRFRVDFQRREACVEEFRHGQRRCVALDAAVPFGNRWRAMARE